jgi:hypothetical protein
MLTCQVSSQHYIGVVNVAIELPEEIARQLAANVVFTADGSDSHCGSNLLTERQPQTSGSTARIESVRHLMGKRVSNGLTDILVHI